MISKILASVALTTVAGDGVTKTPQGRNRPIRKRVRNQADDFPATNEALISMHGGADGCDADDCLRSVTRLKNGPADIDSIIQAGLDDPTYRYTDETFYRAESVYWEHFAPDWTQRDYAEGLESGTYFFANWQDYLPDNHLFVGEAKATGALQGEAGTCYIISSLATVAEVPGEIESLFYTMDDNVAGIYGVKFFVRGKPWLVDVDSELLMACPEGLEPEADGICRQYLTANQWYEAPVRLKFSQPAASGSMWGALLEKAWAKVKGAYENAEGGFISTGIRALTGAPAFRYYSNALADTETMYDLLYAADEAGYLVGAGTGGGGNDQVTNQCGIAQSHAYTVTAAFGMADSWGNEYDMLIMRNPWGQTGYSDDWNCNDPRWTDELLSQVPFGLDPRESQDEGIFFAEKSIFSRECFDDVTITHFRDGAGYADTWYDAIDADEEVHAYYWTNPASVDVSMAAASWGADTTEGSIYLTVESYYQDVVPNECTTGFAEGMQLENPLVYFELEQKQGGQWRSLDYAYYIEQMHTPLLIEGGDLEPAGEYRVSVTYQWVGSPAPDYTVKLYSPYDLVLTDEAGETNQLFTDGQQPSEWANQWEGSGHAWGVDADGGDIHAPDPAQYDPVDPFYEEDEEAPEEEEEVEPAEPPATDVDEDVLYISGHNQDRYNGAYVRGNDWNGRPHFVMGDKHFYHHVATCPNNPSIQTGYWQLDDRDQEVTGFGDYYNGGFLGTSAELSELAGECRQWSSGTGEVCLALVVAGEEGEVAPGPAAVACDFSIAGHPDGQYNGCYSVGEDWNGWPHFMSDGGAHLYYYGAGGGYWQLDYNDQDGTEDLYDGGYLRRTMGQAGWESHYDAQGYVELPFRSGAGNFDLGFQEGGSSSETPPTEAAEETVTISGHSSNTYNGVYYRAEDWGGDPHFEHANGGAHLYHIGSYWQLDDRDQDGGRDWFRGGYYTNPDGAWTTNLDREQVAWSSGRTLVFEHEEAREASLVSLVASLQQKPEPYSGLAIASFAIIAVAILAGIRQVMKKGSTKSLRPHEESLVGSEPIPA